MNPAINIVGQKFGKLTVLEQTDSDASGTARWICVCDCGNTTVGRGSALRNGGKKSCGCARPLKKNYSNGRKGSTSRREPRDNFSGKRFGRLTVVEWKADPDTECNRWLCICDCGKHTYVRNGDLKNAERMSCGCRKVSPGLKTHGKSYTTEYKTWAGMIHRCTDTKVKNYKDYGGRGITVCQRWLESVDNFIEDMGERPNGLTLDRINNDDGYHCGHCEECVSNNWAANCRWATWHQQASNKRNTRKPEL